MRRLFLIVFQSVMAIACFGFAAFSFTQTRLPQIPSSVMWLVWVRAFCAFLMGLLFMLFAGRNLLRVGKAYQAPEAEE